MTKQNAQLKLADVQAQVAAQATILDWQTSLQQACYDAITAEDVKSIVAKQVEKAKAGDENALKFVFGHVLGGNRNVTINNTQVITDVATAAKMHAARSKSKGA